jgi:hypothetical protein
MLAREHFPKRRLALEQVSIYGGIGDLNELDCRIAREKASWNMISHWIKHPLTVVSTTSAGPNSR